MDYEDTGFSLMFYLKRAANKPNSFIIYLAKPANAKRHKWTVYYLCLPAKPLTVILYKAVPV